MKDKINKYGQFFTEVDMCDWTLNIVNNIKPIIGKILEPSFGSGNFLNSLKKYQDIQVHGVEIDKEHYNNANLGFCRGIDSVNVDEKHFGFIGKEFITFNEDFLEFNKFEKYDFIIGNPPYIELCYSFYEKDEQDLIKKKYKGISNGRVNLVHIFMDKSMNMISDDGVIAFLLPSSILTSPTYKGVRKKIFEGFQVEYLSEDVNFQDVAIKVCLLVIRKKKNDGKYFYLNNDNYFIMTGYDKFKNTKTLKDFGFNVSIGEVVWNQKKNMLSDDKTDNMLLYSTNIEYDGLKLDISNTRDRKQFIKGQSIKYENCIVIPRTISKKIKFYFIKNNKNYIFENHLLVLTHTNLKLLEVFYKNLKDGVYNELLNSFFNSSNLTKGELLSLPLHG